MSPGKRPTAAEIQSTLEDSLENHANGRYQHHGISETPPHHLHVLTRDEERPERRYTIGFMPVPTGHCGHVLGGNDVADKATLEREWIATGRIEASPEDLEILRRRLAET